MAIDINPSLQNTVSAISTRTVSPSLDTDVKKTVPAGQEKTTSVSEITDSKRDFNLPSSNQLSVEQLDNVVSKLNYFVEQQKRDIRFSVDEDTNKTIVKLLDANGDVLKQIPSEEVLAILKSIEQNKGLFFETDA